MGDTYQISLEIMWLFAAAGIVAFGGKRGLVGVGIILALLMAFGIFPPHWKSSAIEVEGEPITAADRARAVDVPVDDEWVEHDGEMRRVLRRVTVRVCNHRKPQTHKENQNQSRGEAGDSDRPRRHNRD